MNRRTEGILIVVGALAIIAGVLSMTVAWGPHNDCVAQFPKVIDCALGSYESLSGGLIAAAGALFAGWLAWSAARDQVVFEKRQAQERSWQIKKSEHEQAARGLAQLEATKRNSEALLRRLREALLPQSPYANKLFQMSDEHVFPTTSVDLSGPGIGMEIWEAINRLRMIAQSIYSGVINGAGELRSPYMQRNEARASEAVDVFTAVVQTLDAQIERQKAAVESAEKAERAARPNIAIMGELQHDEADPRPSFVSAPLPQNDAPNVLAPAALILLLALLAGVTLDDVVWFGILGQVPEVPRLVIGITSVLIGARIIFQGRAVLRRSGMHFVLYRPSLALATGGIFARTRNPMYQGMCVAVLGLAFLLRSDWTTMLLLLAAPVIHYGLVRREERYLERKFGDDYVRITKQVPRYGWLFWPSAGERPLAKDWLVWTVAAAVSIVAAYSALWLTDVAIEAMEEPGVRTAAFARASVRSRASLMAAARKAGLRRSDVNAIVDEIRRIDDGRVNIRGWAAEIGGNGSPLTILGFIDGANVFETKTRGERPDVTRALKLSAVAARNVAFEDTLVCRRGQKLIIAATTVSNRYFLLNGWICP